MALSGANIIAGDRSKVGDKTFTAYNPRTKAQLDTQFHEAAVDEVNRAAEAAAEAFKVTRHYSAVKLAEFLDSAADEIEAIRDELIQVADEETGLGVPRLTGECGRTTNQLRAFGRLLREGSYVEAIIDTAQPDRQPAPRPDIRRMLRPLGPAAVFTPNNFPLAFGVAGGDTASAFAAGCPVIVKGHPSHPGTSELVAGALSKAVEKGGFPAGFFSLLQSSGIETGQALVTHPAIEAVGFTGSLRGGRAIYDACAARPRPIPVYAEMGSINPVVILPGAVEQNPDGLAEGLVNSVTLGAGQFCTNPGSVFVLRNKQTEAFIDKVSELMDAKAQGVLLNAGVESSLERDVPIVAERNDVKKKTNQQVSSADCYTYPNTVLHTTSAAFRDDVLQNELFGPVTLFVVCEDMDDLKQSLSVMQGNLTGTVHAAESEIDDAGEVLSMLETFVGRVILNGFPTGVEVVHAMQHGGPYPASTNAGTTSVGMTAIKRFMRPVAYQGLPDTLLPDALKDANPLGIWRIVDNAYTQGTL